MQASTARWVARTDMDLEAAGASRDYVNPSTSVIIHIDTSIMVSTTPIRPAVDHVIQVGDQYLVAWWLGVAAALFVA